MSENIKELVSLLRKYAYEFCLANDDETYDLMIDVQKKINDLSNAKDARIKELEAALKAADAHYKFVELGYVGLIDLKHQLLNALPNE